MSFIPPAPPPPPVLRYVSPTLLEQDTALLHAMLHSSDGCMTAMSTTEEHSQGHSGGHNEYRQRIFLHFYISFLHQSAFFFSPLKKILTCMCWFHQENLKQLTVSPLRPHCCLNTYIPTTNPLSPLRASLPHSLLSPPCPSKPLLIYLWTSFHQRQITPLSNVCCVVPKSVTLPCWFERLSSGSC